MTLGPLQVILVVLLVVLLFGRGKISELMGDVAKGIKSFKKGLTDDDEAVAADKSEKVIEHESGSTSSTSGEKHKVS